MKTSIQYKRNNPSSISGDSITLNITYSSFNSAEIDAIEQYYKEKIGYILMMDDTEGKTK